jgi:F0F1-type ATP synthase gamma subunit
MNKVRQAAITREIIEVVSGARRLGLRPRRKPGT